MIRFHATNEGVNLNRVGLKLTNTASSSSADLVQVSIWNGATQVGTAVFTGSNTAATSTFATPVALPNNADLDLTVKVDFAQIGTGYTGVQGDLVAVDFNAADTTGTQGTGVSSGITTNATGGTAVSGVRLFKSFPTVAAGSLLSTGMADGKLMRFAVTANANGGIGLNQFKFTIATSTGITVSGVNLYGYTDGAYSTAISGFASGQIATANQTPSTGTLTITPTNGTNTTIEVPAGTTYYFELRGTTAGTITGSSVITTLLGDASYPALSVAMATVANIPAASNVIWSPNATTTSGVSNVDWTNAYGVVGLPSSGLIQSRSN